MYTILGIFPDNNFKYIIIGGLVLVAIGIFFGRKTLFRGTGPEHDMINTGQPSGGKPNPTPTPAPRTPTDGGINKKNPL